MFLLSNCGFAYIYLLVIIKEAKLVPTDVKCCKTLKFIRLLKFLIFYQNQES
jgi:hypothetical protein